MERIAFLAISIVFLTALWSEAADDLTPAVDIPYIEEGAEIDGILDDPAWGNAARFTLDWETEPGENLRAPVKTEVFLYYTRGFVYVAFKAEDPNPENIRARFWERDKQRGDDEVWIEFDTFNDGQTAYVFQSNCIGVQSDFMYNSGTYDESWDGLFDCAGVIHPDGYVVEFKIPFSSLTFQASDTEQVWGVLFGRSYPRDVNHQLWSMQRDLNSECHVCQFIKIRGFKGVQPGNNIEFTPTLNGIQTKVRDGEKDDFRLANDDIDAGFNASWGITNNTKAGITINPDFSQVEADALQLDINSPFALSFEEKRPFFTEGANIFQTHMNMVYTRSIRDPEWGLKLHGKQGKNSYGLLMVEDSVTNILFPGSQRSRATSLRENSTVTIGRYSRDVMSNSKVSGLFTNRESESYYSRLYGLDANLQLTKSDRIIIEAMGSSTKYSDEIAGAFGQPLGEFGGEALNVYYMHDRRSFDFVAHYMNIGDDFRADAGFIPQVGYRKAAMATSNIWYDKDESWWDIFLIDTVARDYRDKEGNLLSRQVAVSLVTLGARQSMMRLQGQVGRQTYLGEEYNQNFLRFIGQCVPLADVTSVLYFEAGDQVDYANARAGNRVFMDAGLTYTPSKHVSLGYTHTFERMRAAGSHLYTANIGALTAKAHFSSRLMARLIAQYVDYQYSAENYLFDIDPQFNRFTTQFLLSYKVNPRTLVFVGYSDNYSGDSAINLRKDDYTLFAKISYAFRL